MHNRNTPLEALENKIGDRETSYKKVAVIQGTNQ